MLNLARRNNPAIKNDLISTMEGLQNDMRSFFGGPMYPMIDSDIWAPTETNFMPASDIVETDKGYHVEVEIPGMSPKDVEIELRDNVLIIQGEKKTETEKNVKGVLRKERSYGSFYRSLPFSQEVDLEKVSAKMKDGVLTVELKKNPDQAKKSRQIPISS